MSSEHHHSLRSQIEGFITNENSEGFETLALSLFRSQFATNLPYQRFCQSLNKTPQEITRWQEVPAVPNQAFKMATHPLSEGPTTFLTSGTTRESRGAHHFPDTKLYDLAALTHWQAHLPALPLYFLTPSPSEAPNSSLFHMFEHLHRSLDSANPEPFLLRDAKFHLSPLHHLTKPAILCGTALAFLHLLENHTKIPLPVGSQLLETGGYKGTSRTLEKPELYRQLADFFSLPATAIHNEYGMTEISSQAYASGSQGSHRFPHWCRFQILCPETDTPLPVGETGYLQIHDLANLHSVSTLRTQDFASAHPDGSFTLLGRDPGALPRGCSRSSDALLSS